MMQTVAEKETFDQVLDQVLASPRYWGINQAITDQVQSLTDKISQWLEALITHYIKGIDNAKQLSTLLSVIIIIVISIILITALIYLIRYIYKCVIASKKVEEILGEKITKETTPFTLKEKGEFYRQQGEYRMSIRYSYIGLLLMMHEKGLLHIEKTMTNKEIYECLEEKGYQDLAAIKEVMAIFNTVWYGHHDCDAIQYKDYAILLTDVWNEVAADERR